MPDSIFDGVSAPDLVVEIGWAYTSGGTGTPSGFILNVGQLDITAFSPDVIWTASADVLAVQTNRGKDKREDDTGVSSCTILLDNVDGTYDPNNTAGPLYSGSQIQPMRLVRVRAVWNGVTYGIFYGHIVDFEYDMGEEPTCSLLCADGLDRLANEALATIGQSFSGDLTGARLNRILDTIAWDATMRVIDAGNVIMPATVYGAKVLELMNAAQTAEQGHMFINQNGKLAFYDGRAEFDRTASTVVQVTLSDEIGGVDGLLFTAIDVEFGGSQVVNSWTVTRIDYADPPTAVPQLDEDSTSVNLYTRRSDDKSDVALQTDTVAMYLAQYLTLRSKDPQFRVRSITMDMLGQAAAGFWDEVLALDMVDRLRVRRNYTSAYTFDRELLVCGISHNISADKWSIEFRTFDPNLFDGFRLDLSHLDGGDALVY